MSFHYLSPGKASINLEGVQHQLVPSSKDAIIFSEEFVSSGGGWDLAKQITTDTEIYLDQVSLFAMGGILKQVPVSYGDRYCRGFIK